MHILFLTDNFPPETNAPASRTFEHAKEWVSAGHQVTVVTCAPNFPKGIVFDGYRNRLWQSEVLSGIKVIRVWSFITANEGFVLRILDYQSYMLTGFFASLFVRRVDVVVGTSPQLFTTMAAYAVSLLKWKPFIFELRDLWPESIRAVGAIKDSKVLDFLEKIELFLYRRSTVVVSVTRSFKKNLIERGIDSGKIHVVTNGVEASRFSPMEKDLALLESYQLKGCFVAGYIGTHGMAHGLDTLVDAARILQETPGAENIRIVFIGGGAFREKVMARSIDLEIQNVIFVDSVPKEQVTRYWSLLDVSVIHLRKSELFKTVIPSKIFECFGMGLPVLLGVQGESAEILEEYEAGATFEPENAEELAAAILKLRENPELQRRYSENGQQAAKSFNRQTLAKNMLDIMQKQVVRKV